MIALLVLLIDKMNIEKLNFQPTQINPIELLEAILFSLLLLHITRLTASLNFKLDKPSKYFIELGIIPMEESPSYALAYHVSLHLYYNYVQVSKSDLEYNCS